MRLQIDQGKSADPVSYLGRHHEILGKELTGYLVRHDLIAKKSRGMGDTTRYGIHPFLLTSKPDIDDVMYWNTVKRNGFPILLSCNGRINVLDHNGDPFIQDKQYSTAKKPVVTQQQKKRVLNQKAERLIKKYFR